MAVWRDMHTVDLTTHTADLMGELLNPTLIETSVAPENAAWLLERYREIVPVVLPDVMRCIGSGSTLTDTTKRSVRDSASGCRAEGVPLAVVVRGGVPALRGFAAFVQSLDTPLDPLQLSAVMGRASLIAWELSALWLEGWLEPRVDPVVDGDSLRVEVAVDAAAEIDPALTMVALAAEGNSTEQIAAATAYSPQAVTWHLGRLMRTWKVGNRSALISVGFLRGVLSRRSNRPPAPGE